MKETHSAPLIGLYKLIVIAGIFLYCFPSFDLLSEDQHSPTFHLPFTNDQKVVFLILDGFSFRFSHYSESQPHKSQFYSNQIKVFDEYLKKQPKNTIHIKKTVESPTWTKLAINSMITGNVPVQSLSSMLSNSKPNSISNLFTSLTKANKRVKFFGDIIWESIIYNYSSIVKDYRFFNWYSTNSEDLSDYDVFREGYE